MSESEEQKEEPQEAQQDGDYEGPDPSMKTCKFDYHSPQVNHT